MPAQPPITQEWRDYDRRQRRRVLWGTAAFVAMIAAAIAIPMCVAWAEFGSNLDRGYDRATGGVGVSVGGGDRPTDPFGEAVSGGSPRDQQPFGARSGGGGVGANDHVGSGGSNSNDVGQGSGN